MCACFVCLSLPNIDRVHINVSASVWTRIVQVHISVHVSVILFAGSYAGVCFSCAHVRSANCWFVYNVVYSTCNHLVV